MGQAFQSISWEAIANVPSYGAWWRAADDRPAYDYHRLVLQVLQSGGVGGRWTLKSPHHALALDALVDTYPDARLVLLHRDPVALVGSVCSLVRVMSSTSPTPTTARTSPGTGRTPSRSPVRRIDDFRARRPQHPILDVAYAHLARDPLGTMMALYAFGLAPEVGAFAAVERYLVEHPRREFGSHSYDVGEFGLTEASVRSTVPRLQRPVRRRARATRATSLVPCEYSSPAPPAASAGSSLWGWPSAATRWSAFGLVPRPNSGLDGAWHTADCADPDAVADVFEAEFAESSLDAVVHMAGHPGELSLPESLTSHVVTTAALLDAMVERGVRRLVYGGSNHAVGRTPRAGLPDGLLTAETRLRPDTFYGVAKASAETLMSLYADRHGLDVVSCRIGSFRAEPTTARSPGRPAIPTATVCGWSRPR